ncbi:MAG: GNAT family N-acetyltransferase [Calditrichia bacterium]
MKIDILHSEDVKTELDLSASWSRLSTQHFPHLCNSYFWQATARKSYFASTRPTYLICHQDKELVGIIPFLKTRGQFAGLPVYRYHFFEQHINLCSLMLREDYIPSLLHSIFVQKKALLPNTCLFKITAQGRQIIAIDSFIRKNRNHFSALALPKTIQRTEAGNRADFLQNVLSKKHLKRHKAFLRKSFNGQTLTLERTAIGEKVDDIPELWQRFLDIYRSGWKHNSPRSITRNANDGSFFEQIFSGFAASRNLHCTILKAAEKDIAISWSVNYLGKAFGLQTAFRSDYQQLSPGKLVMVEHIADYFDHGTIFDLMGNHSYKSSLSNQTVEYCDYYLFRTGVYSTILRQLAKFSPLHFQQV